MDEEIRQSRSVKIRPSILRKAHHRAIESQKRVGEWAEEAIEEKIEMEQKNLFVEVGCSGNHGKDNLEAQPPSREVP